jgi:hypothetical protein
MEATNHISTKTVRNWIHTSLTFLDHKGYLWNQEL